MGPFSLTLKQNNANRLYCLNREAERQGLHPGMSYSDARAFCPDLKSRPADPIADQQFQHILRRWAIRYCPWVGLEGRDGLILDISGAAHLLGGEEPMLNDIRQRLIRAGFSCRIGIADTRGAAWALARYGEGIAQPDETLDAIAPLPVAALRLDEKTITTLQRLGLRTIGDLAGSARAPLTRRFGPELLLRLDQALGDQPETISPEAEPPHYGVRMTFPDPIGLQDDVMAGVSRLLDRLCDKFKARETGTRRLQLTLRRVDAEAQKVELRFARPLRDAERILPLFERGVESVDAGFGIDQMRLEATQVEPLPVYQISHVSSGRRDKLDDLISRLGTRIGLENIQRPLPADSHIPERSYQIAAAAYSEPEGIWSSPRPRPIRLFPPEAVAEGNKPQPPERFRWRRMSFTAARATGPERITPEWWFDDENWHTGIRDYWFVETVQGQRLWMFYTPQKPGWYVQGEFA